MNILITSIGAKTYFNPKNWDSNGGNTDLIGLLLSLVNNNPDIKFIYGNNCDILSISQEQINTLFPYKNIIFPFSKGPTCKEYYYNSLSKYNFDSAVVMSGIQFPALFENTIPKNETEYYKPPFMSINSAATIYALNKINVPTIICVNDPRCIFLYKEASFQIIEPILSQYTEIVQRDKWDFDNKKIIKTNHEYIYSELEKSVLVGTSKISPQKNQSFGLICNQGSSKYNAINRYSIVKEYILNNFSNDVPIYGKWDEDIIQSNNKFKGIFNIFDIEKVCGGWKYSLCIPIGIGWVTTKYLELLKLDIIPFFHPYYDQQRHINIPDFLRIKTPKDLKEKIDYLNDNDFYRKSLLNEMNKSFFGEGNLLGYNLNDKIMKRLYTNYENAYNNKVNSNILYKYKETFKEEASVKDFF